MKPNDEAYREFMRVYNKTHVSLKAQIMASLTAAYAAQFKSVDYAGLVKWLRDKAESLSEIYPPEAEAADALEAVLAERDEWKGLQRATAAILKQVETVRDVLKAELAAANKRAANRLAVEAERDALAARLAPVEDEALLVIAGKALCPEIFPDAFNAYGGLWVTDKQDRVLGLARAAIAAIRPHIEAAERERIADTVKNWGDEPHFQLLAAAIRSGK